MNINQKQLETALNMQNNMNKTINENWVGLGWDYMRATMVESVEGIEHHGWKWWKKQTMDLAQLQMELVDIFHFYLSRYLQIHNGYIPSAQNALTHDYHEEDAIIFDGSSYELGKMNILEKLDLLTGLAAAKRMNISLFFSLCHDCHLDWNELYKQYIKKNLLNIFRQKNGYNHGTYEKNWFDKEDNVFLVEESNKLDSTQDDYADALWNALEDVYQKALTYRAERNKEKK